MECFCAFGIPGVFQTTANRQWPHSGGLAAQQSSYFVGARLHGGSHSRKKRARAHRIPFVFSAAPSDSKEAPTSNPADISLSEAVGISPVVLESASKTTPGPPKTLGEGLVALFNNSDSTRSSSEVLNNLLAPNVQWTMPLFKVSGLPAVVENLDSLRAFILDPRVQILEENNEKSVESVEWLFSFVYPLPWRPRVLLSGRSTASRDASEAIIQIEDDWNRNPLNVLSQGLPRLQDFIWLWPSPHAETDIGARRVEKRTRDYDVVTYVRHPEFRTRGVIKAVERHAIWSTPALPEHAFSGAIRRKEAYDAVSPMCVRKISENLFEWGVAIPGSAFGTDLSTLENVDGESRFTMIPRRRLAVTRFRGFASAPKFLKRRDRLLELLVRDGLLDDDKAKDESRVWSRQYDCKLGFNTSIMPTLATYGFSQGIPRVNEIAVELDDVFD